MKVTYIHHSGFSLELPDRMLVFDWFKGELPETDKPIYVFSSHRHHDHFDPMVFDIGDRAKYILSNDIRMRPEGCDITKIGPHKTVEVDGMVIETLKSTDEGVAFIVTVGDRVIYHAGDLHFWLWEEENDEDRLWNENMTKKFLSEIDKIRGRHFDIAFVPLDPRQGAEYMDKGMEAVLERCTADHVFPMHLWGDHSVIPAFKERHPQYAPVIADITREGQVFEM